jgi:Cys-Gly metallodipeptidase DUG1
MAHWLNAQLRAVGVETELKDLGKQTLEGKELDLPPAVLGRIGNDPNKKTVLVYGHFDVQPVRHCPLEHSRCMTNPEYQAEKSDGWESDPFTLTIKEDGRLVGRGSTDDKGPVLGWLNVLQYHFDNKKELPVNLRCCFEGMEETGSEGLDALVIKEAQKGGWFDGVDAVCIVSILYPPPL